MHIIDVKLCHNLDMHRVRVVHHIWVHRLKPLKYHADFFSTCTMLAWTAKVNNQAVRVVKTDIHTHTKTDRQTTVLTTTTHTQRLN